MTTYNISFNCAVDSSDFGQFSNIELPYITLRIFRSDDDLTNYKVVACDGHSTNEVFSEADREIGRLLETERGQGNILLLWSLQRSLERMKTFLEAHAFGTITYCDWTIQSTPSR